MADHVFDEFGKAVVTECLYGMGEGKGVILDPSLESSSLVLRHKGPVPVSKIRSVEISFPFYN